MFNGKRLNFADAKRALKRGRTLEVWFEGKNATEPSMAVTPEMLKDDEESFLPTLREACAEHKVTAAN